MFRFLIFIPLVLILLGLYILWLNRGSERIIEVLVTITAGIVIALSFITKEEEIKKSFIVAYFTDSSQSSILNFIDERVLSGYYFYQSATIGEYFKKVQENKSNETWDFSKDLKPLIDLQSIAILDQLFTLFPGTWYVESKDYKLPNFTCQLYSPKEKVTKDSDIKKFSKDSLDSSFKQNIFFEGFKSFQLSVPKGTKITYNLEKEQPSSTIRLYKPSIFGNIFDITIQTGFSSNSVGLGVVGDFIGITDYDRKYTDLADSSVKNYRNINLEITCKAKFNRWVSWNPDVIKYKEWAKFIFDRLSRRFDWEVVYQQMLEDEQILANRKIINTVKGLTKSEIKSNQVQK